MVSRVHVTDILATFNNPQLLSDRGAQKLVYTIEHPVFGVSVLKIGGYDCDNTLARIRREVSILQDISSPYFPIIHDFSIVDSSRYYVIEELMRGETLTKEMNLFGSEANATKLLYELSIALSQLWRRNVVHRDIKPDNIIIVNSNPRVLDLGIARVINGETLTHPHAPFGPCTPNYASPEQLQNRKRNIDYRTDQFSLAIVIAQVLLGGTHPFSPAAVGNSNSIPNNILSDTWARTALSDHISGPLFGIILKMLGHEPYTRFRKMDELEQCVRSLLQGVSL